MFYLAVKSIPGLFEIFKPAIVPRFPDVISPNGSFQAVGKSILS